MNILSRATLTGIVFVSVLSFSPAFAETLSFKAALTGAEEVPATTTKGVGQVDAMFDTVTMKLSWKGTYSGLSGPTTAAHFHGPADKGANAGVLIPAPAALSPFEGSATLTKAQETELMAGKVYFNIHTAANTNGEIRGQISKK